MLQGWGGKSLLDSYESERKPIAVRNTRAARAIAKQVGILDIPSGVEEDSANGAAQRLELGAQIATYLGTQFAPLGVELGARYDGSPIVASDEAAPTDSIVQYIPTGQPGGRAPHSLARRRTRHRRFIVRSSRQRLHVAAPRTEITGCRALAAAAQERGVPLGILDMPDASRARPLRRRLGACSSGSVRRLARRHIARRCRRAAGPRYWRVNLRTESRHPCRTTCRRRRAPACVRARRSDRSSRNRRPRPCCCRRRCACRAW